MRIINNTQVPLNEITFTLQNSQINFDTKVKEHIELTWKEVLELRSKQGRNLYDGQLFEFKKFSDKVIRLAPDTISYKTIVGLRAGEDKPEEEVFACSIFCLLLNKKGEVLLRKRDEGEWEIGVEVPGGFIVPNDNGSPVGAFVNKINADLGYQIKKKERIMFRAMYQSKEIFETPIISSYLLSVEEEEEFKEHPDVLFVKITRGLLERKDLHEPTKAMLSLVLDKGLLF